MPEGEHNIFAGAGEIGADSRAVGSSINDSSPALVLRAHGDSGDFLGSVTCSASHITMLVTNGGEAHQVFRNALIGAGGSEQVTMRLGERVLHASEVYAASRADYVWRAESLQDAFVSAGYADNALKAIAERLGLSNKLSTSPSMLSKAELRSVIAACAFRARSQVLLFDRPFNELDTKETNTLAEFLAEGARLGDGIVIVTGVEKAPAPWKDSEMVSVEGATLDFLSRTTQILTKEADVGQQLRSLRRSPSQILKRETFVTRPQTISFAARGSREQIKAEAIENPNVVSKKTHSVQQAESMAQGMRSTPTGKLTRVTGTVRMRRSRGYVLYRRVKRGLVRALVGTASESEASLGRKAHWVRRVNELKVFLLIVLALLASMLLFYKVNF